MMSSIRSSRPNSAMSRRSSLGERRNSVGERESFLLECKAAYMTMFEDLRTNITSKTELYKVLQQTGRNPISRTLNKYWTSRTEYLTFEDFCEICRKEPVTSEDELLKAFRKIDVNGDGYITNTELRKILTTKGERMTKEEVQDLIDEVDENGDGRLNYREFIQMVMRTQEECKKLAMRHYEKKQGQTTDRGHTGSRPSSRQGRHLSDDDDDDDDDEIVIGVSRSSTSSRPFGHKSSSPPTPTPRSNRSTRDHSDDNLSSRRKEKLEWTKPGLTSKQLTLQKPKNLRDWRVAKSKGCFFLDEDSKVIGHQYALKVGQDTRVWMTIEPLSVKSGDLVSVCEKNGAPVDAMLFVLDADNKLIAFTDHRDQKGKSGVTFDLEKGNYRLIAFTTGCRLRRRLPTARHAKETELLRRKDGKVTLTKDYKNALIDIFDLFDLNGDGLLSRDEFNLYNLRTSGQEVADPEWEAVEANIDLKDGQITREGFLQLSQMEAEENQDNLEELWIPLEALGFSRSLVIDEMVPFVVEAYAERGNISLKVSKLGPTGKNFGNLIVQQGLQKAETFKIKGGREVYLHVQFTDTRASLVVENKSVTKSSVVVDCRDSHNVISHHGNLTTTVEIPPKSSVVAHHLLPVKDSHPWTVVCQDSMK